MSELNKLVKEHFELMKRVDELERKVRRLERLEEINYERICRR